MPLHTATRSWICGKKAPKSINVPHERMRWRVFLTYLRLLDVNFEPSAEYPRGRGIKRDTLVMANLRPCKRCGKLFVPYKYKSTRGLFCGLICGSYSNLDRANGVAAAFRRDAKGHFIK